MAPDVTVVFSAGRFLTMEPGFPEVEAVAVRGGRIVAVGSRASVTRLLGDAPFVLDERFAGQVVLPGLIDQHLHPILGATTLATEVISTETWILPGKVFPAADSEDAYRRRLREADEHLDGDDWLFSWGYHELWHGPLDRGVLDQVSTSRPIGVWQRSCHEWYLNSAAIEELGITEAAMRGQGPASDMVDLDAGHWWEAGAFTLLFPVLAAVFLTPDRLTHGLRQMVAYLHRNGVTAFNEPGIVWAAEPFDLYRQILGAEDTPMLSTFLVDARSQAEAGMDPADAVADAERQVAIAPDGKVSLVADQVKLFADGAIISQLMQMRDGYVDGDGAPDPDHVGEWLMEPDVLARFARVYWDAGWQLHIHVTGDLGLDVVLDVLESCMVARPRADHRSVIVHFANSTEEQVDRIARLGAIVSANPYYPAGFADRYGAYGLGPERADVMVRSASARARSIPLSFHSDLPMAPAEPLKLVWCAVNRLTQSGRVAAPEQRIGVQDALRAVTIEAAYSWRREHDLGSIAPGKMANFTVLADDPHLVDPADLDRIPVVGTLFEGRWFPVEADQVGVAGGVSRMASEPSGYWHGGGCSCRVARLVAQAVTQAA